MLPLNLNYRFVGSIFTLPLLIVIVVVGIQPNQSLDSLETLNSNPNITTITSQQVNNTNNNNNNNNSTNTTTDLLLLNPNIYPPITNDNITILHEVHDGSYSMKKDRPDILLPLKTTESKSFSETVGGESNREGRKQLVLQPVVFDFNLGDLEDLEHENYKKDEHLLAEEKLLLNNIADGNNNNNNNKEELSITAEPSITERFTTAASMTVSPHIFKVTKIKSSKKGRELLQRNDPQQKLSSNNYNSIYRYFKNANNAANNNNNNSGSSSSSSSSNNNNNNGFVDDLNQANAFQMVINLYDHFYWQMIEVKNRISTACSLELQAYLTALHANYHWAQQAYDASGRYRGQLFFGNDKWLGQKLFCQELNRQLEPTVRKHFEFAFFTALINIRMWLPKQLEMNLQLGQCLPKSCTNEDVRHILEEDPHAQILAAINTFNSDNNTSIQVRILRVRTVPGSHNYWHERKFQIFISFLISLLVLVVTATWYQSKLNSRQYGTPSIAIIKSNMNAETAMVNYNTNNPKQFELYQMTDLNENHNNRVDIEGNPMTDKKSQITNTHWGFNCGFNSEMPDSSSSNITHNNNMNNDNNNNTNTNNNSNSNSNSNNTTTDSGHNHCNGLQNINHPAGDVDGCKVEVNSFTDSLQGGYDLKPQLSLHQKLLLCFAFQTNAACILNVDINKESQTSCLHGLRVISVLWTIMVHTYLQMFSIGENRFRRVMVERSPWYQIVGNATFSVDTFFYISGFLVTLLFLKHERKYTQNNNRLRKKDFLDIILLVIYRYIRLTPAYLFVILLNDFALRYSIDNSVFQPAVAPNTCNLYWWRNILYINNFYPLSEICMIWSWYMANEMQFYIMATILLILAKRYLKSSILILLTFLISSWGVSGVISLRYHYTHKVASPFESFDFLYDKPWQRVGPYIIGMLTAYIIQKVRTPPKISASCNALLWSLSLALLSLIIFGVWGGQLDEIPTAFYVSIGHTAFGFGFFWIVLSCCWGLAPVANQILSYRCLWPLSRLTYCAYLIHPLIMLITAYRMDGTVSLTNIMIIVIFLGNAVVSFTAAFFISVLLEAPIIRLLKILYGK